MNICFDCSIIIFFASVSPSYIFITTLQCFKFFFRTRI